MTMSQQTRVCQHLRQIGVELCEQHLTCVQAHKDTPTQKQAADAQRSNALHLAISIREAFTGRFQRQGHGTQGQKVRDQVGQRMVGIGNQRLRVEDITTDELADRHAQVGDQANAGDADARIVFVGRREVDIVVVVVVTVAVAMATMASSLRHGEWCEQCTG